MTSIRTHIQYVPDMVRHYAARVQSMAGDRVMGHSHLDTVVERVRTSIPEAFLTVTDAKAPQESVRRAVRRILREVWQESSRSVIHVPTPFAHHMTLLCDEMAQTVAQCPDVDDRATLLRNAEQVIHAYFYHYTCTDQTLDRDTVRSLIVAEFCDDVLGLLLRSAVANPEPVINFTSVLDCAVSDAEKTERVSLLGGAPLAAVGPVTMSAMTAATVITYEDIPLFKSEILECVKSSDRRKLSTFVSLYGDGRYSQGERTLRAHAYIHGRVYPPDTDWASASDMLTRLGSPELVEALMGAR